MRMEADHLPWIVAMGASGGQGLQDIKALLAALPERLPAAILVVLHRPINKISHLREILERCSAIPVIVARQDEPLRPGVCYIGEPDAHLTLVASELAALVPDATNAYRNRTIDLLFGSLAKAAAPRIVGVVLSGSLDDGSRGLASIHLAGGRVMVMTPDLASSGQMPGSAARYDGPMDFIGGAEAIADEVARTVGGGRAGIDRRRGVLGDPAPARREAAGIIRPPPAPGGGLSPGPRA
jgi:two-component system chemotaxis response regulator CheB